MPNGPIRILHLEDSALDAQLLERELERAKLSFSSTRLETERDFREALESSEPDVILADYHLPGFDGIAALEIAREIVPETPFIFVSGSIGEERAVQALREGAADYVVKDRPARLASAILRAIDDRRQRLLRRRAQDALKRSDERYKHAIDATQELVVDWNILTDTVVFNEWLKTNWGYDLPAGEVSIEWFFEKIHPDERQAVEESKRAAITSGERWEGRYRFRAANGSYGHVLERAVAIHDETGRVSRAICAILDITEQTLSEEAMRKSEQRFRSVAETASEAVFIFDSERRIVFVNRLGHTSFGYALHDLLGQPIDIVFPERLRDVYRTAIENVFTSGTGVLLDRAIQVQGVRKDGSEFPLDLSTSIWSADGETFFTVFIRDASERVGYERRQEIELAVALILSDADPADAMDRLLHDIGTALGWKVGLYWTIDEQGQFLRCDATWVAEGFDAGDFIEGSCATKLEPGVGLPGRVWGVGRPLVMGDPRDHPEFPGSERAAQLGLRSGFAFPVLEGPRATGVVEFFDVRSLEPYDEPLIIALVDIGHRIGEFLLRGRAEEELRKSQADLADAQRIAQLGSYTFHVPTGTVTWSAVTYQLFGASPDTFQPSVESFLEQVHPEERARIGKIISPPYPAAEIKFQHRILRLDGGIRHVSCRLRVMEGTAASPVRMLGTVQDITERIAAEETILRLSRQNAAILDSVAEGIIGVGPRGEVTFANAAAAAITGFTVEELMAAPSLHDALRHCDAAGIAVPPGQCEVVQTINDGQTRIGKAVFRKKSGEALPVQFAVSRMVLDGGRNGGVLSFTDITATQALERRLQQANRVSSLGRVAATIAHEFNNVLMGIQPFAEVIQRRADGNTKVKDAAIQIANSVRRGKRVTHDILRFAQPSAPALKTTVIGDWIASILPELRMLVGSKIEIRVEMPPRPVIGSCDPSQLHQVITNLVLNARDAIGIAGVITIALDDRPDRGSWSFGPVTPGMIMLSVTDTGSGMSPSVLANIFEPLFTTKRSGTGLGLAVAHQILEAHQGEIHVTSSPGNGTTFHLLLPGNSDHGESEDVQPSRETSEVREILVVEDEPIVAAGIAALLESDGIAVRTVHLGAEVAAEVAAKMPDLVLLDVSLPDMSGPEVFEILSERWPSLPVIFSTGHADESALEELLNVREVGFLRKPYDLDALHRAIDQVTAVRTER